eukprot:1605787-Pleurochrysis_carterae.AAC.1
MADFASLSPSGLLDIKVDTVGSGRRRAALVKAVGCEGNGGYAHKPKRNRRAAISVAACTARPSAFTA